MKEKTTVEKFAEELLMFQSFEHGKFEYRKIGGVYDDGCVLSLYFDGVPRKKDVALKLYMTLAELNKSLDGIAYTA